MSLADRCEELAEHIMFSGDLNKDKFNELLDRYELQYRKEKDFLSVIKAYKKAMNLRSGLGKTEYELSMLALYLRVDVVKNK